MMKYQFIAVYSLSIAMALNQLTILETAGEILRQSIFTFD